MRNGVCVPVYALKGRGCVGCTVYACVMHAWVRPRGCVHVCVSAGKYNFVCCVSETITASQVSQRWGHRGQKHPWRLQGQFAQLTACKRERVLDVWRRVQEKENNKGLRGGMAETSEGEGDARLTQFHCRPPHCPTDPLQLTVSSPFAYIYGSLSDMGQLLGMFTINQLLTNCWWGI